MIHYPRLDQLTDALDLQRRVFVRGLLLCCISHVQEMSLETRPAHGDLIECPQCGRIMEWRDLGAWCSADPHESSAERLEALADELDFQQQNCPCCYGTHELADGSPCRECHRLGVAARLLRARAYVT